MGKTDPSVGELIESFVNHTSLSIREAEVVAHIGEELDRTETKTEARENVAAGLGISPSTVDTHYRRALKKLQESFVAVRLTKEKAHDAIEFDADVSLESLAEPEPLTCPSCESENIEITDIGHGQTSIDCGDCGTNLQVG